MAIVLWGFFAFSFLSIWFLGQIDSLHAGLNMAIQFAPLLGFFPSFATIGMIADRILVKDLLTTSNFQHLTEPQTPRKASHYSKEDIIRLTMILILFFLSLPWIGARLGITQILFFQNVHLGEHHGYIGFYILISVLLISKTEKLYYNSIFKELSIYFLCFSLLWGAGLFLNDFCSEQFLFQFPFVVWGEGADFFQAFVIQSLIIAILSLIIYYGGWRRHYKKIITL
ncbi:MAG: hypothetical protein ACTSRS_20980 [Candidatus Helarchaeota archaeon]